MRLRWVVGILVGLAAVGFLVFGGKSVHTEMPEVPEPTVMPVVIQDEMQLVEKTDEPEPIVEIEKTIPKDIQAQERKDGSTLSAFVLAIRGSRIAVGCETTEEALKKRPGWLNTSARPGEPGVCVVYGHRNRRHLRVLEKVELGDEITATAEDGSVFRYVVTQIDVADDLSEIAIPSVAEPTLMLVTCYPFRYSGERAAEICCHGSEMEVKMQMEMRISK